MLRFVATAWLLLLVYLFLIHALLVLTLRACRSEDAVQFAMAYTWLPGRAVLLQPRLRWANGVRVVRIAAQEAQISVEPWRLLAERPRLDLRLRDADLRLELAGARNVTVADVPDVELSALQLGADGLEARTGRAELRRSRLLINGTPQARWTGTVELAGLAYDRRASRGLSVRLELGGALTPTLQSPVASQPLRLQGRLLVERGLLVEQSKVVLHSSKPLLLRAAGREWSASQGGRLALLVLSDGAPLFRLQTPRLTTSKRASSVSLAELTLELRTGTPYVPPLLSAFATGGLELRARRLTLDDGAQRYESRIDGTLRLTPQRASESVEVAGRLELSNLTWRSAPGAPEPDLAGSLEIERGSLSAHGEISLRGTLFFSGSRFGTLLTWLDLPPSAGWMLSRFARRPFRVTAEVERYPGNLGLHELKLDCGELDVTGVLQQRNDERSGALLLRAGSMRVGLKVAPTGSALIWGADRAWLTREQDIARRARGALVRDSQGDSLL